MAKAKAWQEEGDRLKRKRKAEGLEHNPQAQQYARRPQQRVEQLRRKTAAGQSNVGTRRRQHPQQQAKGRTCC